jgi:hypothetical protein
MIVCRHSAEDPAVHQFLIENSSCFFNRKEWFYVLQEGFYAPVACYCLEEAGKICLALPGMIFNFGIIRMFYSNIPYGGFVGNVQLVSESLPLFEKSLEKDGIQLIRIGKDYSNDFPHLNGYKQQEAFTHVLNLEGMTEEHLWNGYKKRVRRDVRKAEKSGLYVDDIHSPDEIEQVFTLYNQTMKRNVAYTTWTRKSLFSIYDRLIKSGQARLIFAKKEGEIVAGIILLFSEDTVYYFFSASSEKYFQYCPNDLLVHHAICLTIRERKKYFDLMTSKEDDIALMDFKEKWGAQKHPFRFYEKSLNPFRTWVWQRAWWMMNSPAGSRLIRWWRGR